MYYGWFFFQVESLCFDEWWNKNSSCSRTYSVCSWRRRQQWDTLLKVQLWGHARDYFLIWNCVLAAEMWNNTHNTHHANYTAALVVFKQEQQNQSREPSIWEYIIQQLLSHGLICSWQEKTHHKLCSFKKQTCTFLFFFKFSLITRCEQGETIKGPTCKKNQPNKKPQRSSM